MSSKKQFLLALPILCFTFLLVAAPSHGQEVILRPYVGVGTMLMPDKTIENRQIQTDAYGSEEENREKTVYEHRAKLAYRIGLSLEYRTQGKFGLQTSLAVHQNNYTLDYSKETEYRRDDTHYSYLRISGSSENKITCLMQAVMASWAVSGRWQLAAGPYAGVYLRSFQEWPVFSPSVPGNGNFDIVYNPSGRQASETVIDYDRIRDTFQKAGHGYNRGQFGLQAAVSYQYRKLVASAQLQQSMTRLISKEADAGASIYPFTASLTMGYLLKIN